MSTATALVAFQKATLEEPPAQGRQWFAPGRVAIPVADATYDRLIADGWIVVETWNVWTCLRCGMNDSDREHAAWEVEQYGDPFHLARYGHESVHPPASGSP